MTSNSADALAERLQQNQTYETTDMREEAGMLPVGEHALLRVAVFPKGSDTRRWGLVVCHSHFELSALQSSEIELIRAAARIGYPGAYVEAPGIGDSEGEELDCTIDARVDAAIAAWGELKERSPQVSKPCFVGVRSGSITALHCAAKVGQGAALLLWDPVLDADAYWRQVRRLARIAAVAGKQQHFREPQEELSAEGRVTVTGLTITPELLEELRRSAAARPGVGGPVLIVLPRRANEAAVRSQLALEAGARLAAAHLSQRDLWQVGMRNGRDAISPSLEWMKAELT